MAGYIGKQAVVLSTTAADVKGDVTATGDFITDEGKVKAEKVEVENDTGPNMYATAYGTGSTTYTWFEGTDDNKLISWGDNGDISFYDDDGSTVKFRWDAGDNRLGIGTSSPDFSLTVGTTSDSSNYLALKSSATGQMGVLFGDTDADVGAITYHHSNNSMRFYADVSERLRIDSDGLKFNGDTAAANALDDYEEGTWTPAPYVSNVNYATYVKVGRLCYLNFDITMATSTSGSSATISGLPYAPRKAYSAGTLSYLSFNYDDAKLEASSGNYIRVRSTSDGGHLTFANLSNARLIGSIIYEVD